MVQPNSYVGKQYLLASGRIIILARDNDIFLNSKESISLSTNKTINLDSNVHTIINSPNIFLGLNSTTKTQPALRGSDFKDIVLKLIDSIDAMIAVTEKSPQDIPATLVLGLSYIRGTIEIIRETYGKNLSKSLSNITYLE